MDFNIAKWFLESAFGYYQTHPDQLALANLFFIAIVIVFGYFLHKQYKNPSLDLSSSASTILTSLGITGTFVGILLGLQEFNISNIDSSLEKLLDGLKVAFLTSVFGLVSSLLAQFTFFIIRTKKQDAEDGVSEENLSASDFMKVMKAIESGSENQAELIKKQLDALDRLNATESMIFDKIGSASQDSLVTLFKESRKEFSDFDARLQKKLDEVAETLSEGATKQIIEALNNVIKDFNNNLTEQFGENFKRLNDAVLELVTWQDNYKQQMLDMKLAFDKSVNSLDQTATSIEVVSQRSEAIPQSMEKLTDVMLVIQQQISNLDEHMKAFAELRDKATQAIPETQRHLDSVVEDISTTAKEANRLSSEFIGTSENVLKQYKAANEEFAEGVKQVIEQGSERIKGAFEEASGEMRRNLEFSSQSIQQMSESVEKHAKELNDDHKAAIDSVNEKTRAMLVSIDDHQIIMGNSFKENLEQLNNQHQGAMDSSNAKVKETLDSIDQFQNGLSSIFSSSTQNIANIMSKAIDATDDHHKKVQSTFDATVSNLESAYRDVLANTRSASEKMAQDISSTHEQAAQRMTKAISDVADEMSKDTTGFFKLVEENNKEAAAKTRESLQSAVENMERQIANEVTAIVEKMGQGMISISQAVVQDIQSVRSITEEMRKVLRNN